MLKGLSDIIDGVKMFGDGVIEAEAEAGEFWVRTVIMEMKCGTRWRVLGGGGGSVDAKWACLRGVREVLG